VNENNGGMEIIPFGKYKGQPVDVLIADREYREWVMAQDWMRSRYANLYQTIINYGGPPQDSPEHNEMQAAFLDNELCMRLAKKLWPGRDYGMKVKTDDVFSRFRGQGLVEEWSGPSIYGRKFEVAGWDVVFQVEGPSLDVHVESAPTECACLSLCDHAADCPEYGMCRGGDRDICHHRTHFKDGARVWHCYKECAQAPENKRWFEQALHYYDSNWEGVARVELKPDLSDDFPTVLRQVLSYDRGGLDRACVVVRRASFERVTWEQVEAMFAASRIVLIRESDLAAPPPPALEAGDG